ncbi:NUDIX domain-containing protein [Rossellomorea vietnamensis]|uniref:NUDIX domain-containing protein n=1 Tax=Rossellomorea vietnamensis TaxID=218284 RepID=A0A5D4MIE3_9BACI|nr:NUDIX domain-containing protein [Rossellomorea vietnamensis]TYS01338.1 NUDIX domain-containing protein [Rossellomorea vietnamensis]
MNETITFNIKLEEPLLKQDYHKINKREAVRAVILKDNKILLVHSRKGDYKFPGGGMEGDETHSQALKREVAEETGYTNIEVIKNLGRVLEEKSDEFESNCLFSMSSTYYLCRLASEETSTMNLDKYEADLDFVPVWITVEEAIQQNEALIQNIKNNSWLKRETLVLKRLKEAKA